MFCLGEKDSRRVLLVAQIAFSCADKNDFPLARARQWLMLSVTAE